MANIIDGKVVYAAVKQRVADEVVAFKAEYGAVRLNEPKALNGFKGLGVYLMLASDGVSSVPQANLGESILANITTYLYEYDF